MPASHTEGCLAWRCAIYAPLQRAAACTVSAGGEKCEPIATQDSYSRPYWERKHALGVYQSLKSMQLGRYLSSCAQKHASKDQRCADAIHRPESTRPCHAPPVTFAPDVRSVLLCSELCPAACQHFVSCEPKRPINLHRKNAESFHFVCSSQSITAEALADHLVDGRFRSPMRTSS